MRLIQDGMLDEAVGNKLIEIYKNNPSKCALWANTNTLNLAKVEDLDDQLPKKIVFALNNYLNSKGVICYPELVQVVHRPTGTRHDMHVDEARDTTIMTSITYLNDDYEGGETVINGITIKPKKGLIVIFSNGFYLHQVNKITNNSRYTLIAWYKNADTK